MIPQRLTIDPEVVKTYGLNLGEFIYTLGFIWGFFMEEVGEGMVEKGLAKYDGDLVTPTEETIKKVKKSLSSENNVEMTEEQLLSLAKKMKAIYPKGYNADGTPWTEGPKLIAQRLETFFRKYGNYPENDVLSATKTYVEKKFGTPYFRLLKFFIYKETTNARGEVESTSDLYSRLETGAYDEYTFSDEWATEIK